MSMKKLFGLAAVAGLLFVAAPTSQAGAVSLNNPGLASSVQGNEGLTTQVQYRGHYRVGRPHGWRRPPFARRHHGWGRPYGHRRHWR